METEIRKTTKKIRVHWETQRECHYTDFDVYHSVEYCIGSIYTNFCIRCKRNLMLRIVSIEIVEV